MTLRIWIPRKPQKTYFSQTIPPSDVYCFLLKISLSRLNFFDIFHLNQEFRPMKIAPYSLLCHWNEVSKFSVASVFLNWLYSSERKPGNAAKFLNRWKLWILFVEPSKIWLKYDVLIWINPQKSTFLKLLLQVTFIVSY